MKSALNIIAMYLRMKIKNNEIIECKEINKECQGGKV